MSSPGELAPVIAAILTLPELVDAAWDTYSMVVEVSESRIATTAYRYAASAAPVPADTPDDVDPLVELWERTRGGDGEAWDVVVVKVQRDTGRVAMTFLHGADAERWRVNPQNIDHLPELLRPRPGDFPTA